MHEIIKAQMYQYCRKSMNIIIFAIMLIFIFFRLAMYDPKVCDMMGIYTGVDTVTAGRFVVECLQSISLIGMLYIVFNTISVVCSDFSDKTANYEILSGHTRREVYFGRIIWAEITGLAGFALLMLLPVAAAVLLYGWGSEIAVGDMALRWLLMLLTASRLIAELSFVGYVVRSFPPGLLAGFMVFMEGSSIASFFPDTNYFLTSSTLNCLTNIDTWVTYGLDTTERYYTFNASLSPETAVPAAVSSLTGAVIFIFAGYSFFRTEDIN